MNAVKDDIPALVEKELAAAVEVNGEYFPTRKDMYGVIREEFEETQEEMQEIEDGLEVLWKTTRVNSPSERVINTLEHIHKHAVRVSEEAIQVAAMCRKAIITERSKIKED